MAKANVKRGDKGDGSDFINLKRSTKEAAVENKKANGNRQGTSGSKTRDASEKKG